MSKNLLKTLFKFILAFALIFWLMRSGKLDFNILKDILHYPENIALAVILSLINLYLVTFRYKQILKFKSSSKISTTKLFKYNWIGLFFNSVLPGSVSGDIVKVFYIKEMDKAFTKKFLFLSVLIDRVVGLTGLTFLLGIFSFYNYKSLSVLSLNIKNIIDINLILSLIVIFGVVSLFFFKNIPNKIFNFLNLKNKLEKISSSFLELWENLCLMRRKIIFLILISIIIQTIAVIIFMSLASPFLLNTIKLEYAFSFIPLGFIAIAIPIAPSGLGVGHAVFHKLFTYFGIDNGASLFNIYFFLTIIFNTLGVIPYLFLKKKKT